MSKREEETTDAEEGRELEKVCAAVKREKKDDTAERRRERVKDL